MSMLHKTN